MNFFEIVWIIAWICAAIPTIPQIIDTIKTKEVDELSYGMYAIWILGGVCWIIYGRYLHSRQMQVFNTISISLSLIMVFLIRKYRKKN